MRGIKTVIERMEEADRIKQTDKELIEFTTLRTRLQQVESERDKAETDAAVMRGLLKEATDRLATCQHYPDTAHSYETRCCIEKSRTFLNPKPQDVK